MSNVKKVIVVFKTHVDLGFTNLAKNVLETYTGSMMDDLIRVCAVDSHKPIGKRYAWTLPSWMLRECVDRAETSEKKKYLIRLIKQQQLRWHALPFTSHTEFSGMEEYIRGMQISRELEERFCIGYHDAKMTDVPGHTWGLPMLLQQAGIEFLHLGSNVTSNVLDIPSLFWWEGCDGSRVLTYYSKGGYGSDLVPPADWPYPVWLAMLQTNDNSGADDVDVMKRLWTRAERELPEVEVVVGSLQDFSREVVQCGLDIPVVRADLSDSWIRGVASAPEKVALTRETRHRIQTLEAMDSSFGLFGQPCEVEQHIKAAYENLLLVGEHTWGMDCKDTILPEHARHRGWCGYPFYQNGVYHPDVFKTLLVSHVDYSLLASSWEEQLQYAKNARTSCERIYARIQERMPTGNGLMVFHCSGREEELAVEVTGRISADCISLVDEEGKHYPVHRDSDGCHAILPLPSLGGRVFWESRQPVTTDDLPIVLEEVGECVTVTTPHYQLILNVPTATILSLTRNGRKENLVEIGGEYGFGAYVYHVFSHDELHQYLVDYCATLTDFAINDYGRAAYPATQPAVNAIPQGFSLQVEWATDALLLHLTAQISGESREVYGDCCALCVTYRIGLDASFDIKYCLFGKQAAGVLEAIHFVFPLSFRQPQYRLNKLGAVLNPTQDIAGNANYDLFCLENWLTVYDEQNALSIIAKQMPTVSLDHPGALTFRGSLEQPLPIVWMNAYNNCFGSNFPQWLEGDFTFEYRICVHEPTLPIHALDHEATRFLAKPAVFAGTAAASFNVLLAPLRFVRVIAFKRSKHGIILRLFNMNQSHATETIHLADAVGKVLHCDLMEAPIEWISLCNQRFVYTFKPYELASFELRIE